MHARTRAPAPVETAVAIDHTADGTGVLDVGGKRIFVPGVIRGEAISFRRRRQRRNFDEAELVDITLPSALRVEPRCAVFGRCGGCSLQHLAGAAQLELKQQTLLESLRRIGGVTPEQVLPALAGRSWGYRRRARLAVRDVPGKGRVLVGFRERNKPYVTDMQACDTLDPALSRLLPGLSGLLGALTIRSRVPQVEMALGDNGMALVFRVLDPPDPADLALLGAFARESGAQVWLQPGSESSLVPLGARPEALYYRLEAFGLQISFAPLDFVQVHAEVNALMVGQAVRLLDPGPTDRVLDLYSGIGNFALALARRAGSVTGMELSGASVARAALNAQLNGIGNAAFRQLDLAGEEAAAPIRDAGCDLALLDPPRSGAAGLMPVLAATGARRVLYVSCHPGTLARDARVLVHEQGYRLEAAGVLDMFPQTAHVESMALFARS